MGISVKWLLKRLNQLQQQQPTYEQLLMKIGAAQKQVGRAAALVRLQLPEAPPKNARSRRVSFSFVLDKAQLRTVRQALEKLAAMQLLDGHFPTTDGRELIFTRYTEPESDQQLLLAKLGWPPQAPPRLTAAKIAAAM